MRKLLAVLLMLPAMATAGTWKLIIDSTTNTRLLVDVDSVKIENYKKGDTTGVSIGATMSLVSNQDETVFVSIIDAEGCISKQQGGALINIYADKSTNQYFWSIDGDKMYDAQGQWLCGYLLGAINTYQKQQSKRRGLAL